MSAFGSFGKLGGKSQAVCDDLILKNSAVLGSLCISLFSDLLMQFESIVVMHFESIARTKNDIIVMRSS